MEHEGGSPTSSRIKQDCRLAIFNMGVVYRNDGKMVPGLANRNGHRVDKAGSSGWGGLRIKKDPQGLFPWLHPMAAQVLSEKCSKIMEDFTIDSDVASELGLTH